MALRCAVVGAWANAWLAVRPVARTIQTSEMHLKRWVIGQNPKSVESQIRPRPDNNELRPSKCMRMPNGTASGNCALCPALATVINWAHSHAAPLRRETGG